MTPGQLRAGLPPVSELSDADLLARHAAGCGRAFEQLYRRHFDRLVRCASLQGSPDPADAAQEALTKAAAKAATYPGEAACSVSTWLQRILRNTVIDMWRVQRARPTVQLQGEVATRPPSYETTRLVRKTLGKLPPDQAQALAMHYFDGLTAIEISTQLKVNENTVKGRIRLGSAKLRAAMTETAADDV